MCSDHPFSHAYFCNRCHNIGMPADSDFDFMQFHGEDCLGALPKSNSKFIFLKIFLRKELS